MKILFFLIASFLINTNLFAQNVSYSPEAILFKPDSKYYQENVSEVYQGVPIVKIEHIKNSEKSNHPSLKVTPKNELEKMDIPINILYDIKTPFGNKSHAYYTDHTTDFYSKIQILDQSTVSVQEYIQFITTNKGKIKRVISTKFKDTTQHEPIEVLVNSFKAHGKNLSFNITKTDDSFIIESTKEFPSGVHLIQLNYILNNAIQNFNGVSRLLISITGKEWPYAINRFKAIVLYPQKTNLYQNELLFGSNNLIIKDSVKTSRDEKGNNIYSLNHILPAFADIKLFETFDGHFLPKSFSETFFEKYKSIIFAFLSVTFVGLYLFISHIFLKREYQKGITSLKKVNRLPLTILLYLTKQNLTKKMINELTKIHKETKRNKIVLNIFSIFVSNPISKYILKCFLNSFALIYLLFKYIITISIIYIIFMTPLIVKENAFDKNVKMIILVLFFVLITIFYYKSLIPSYQKNISNFKEKILDPYICFGLKVKTAELFFKRFYRTTYLLKIDEKFKHIMKTNHKDITLPHHKI